MNTAIEVGYPIFVEALWYLVYVASVVLVAIPVIQLIKAEAEGEGS